MSQWARGRFHLHADPSGLGPPVTPRLLGQGQPRANNHSRFESRVRASGTPTDAASHFSSGSFGLLPGGPCPLFPFQGRDIVTKTPHLLIVHLRLRRWWVPAPTSEATKSPDEASQQAGPAETLRGV